MVANHPIVSLLNEWKLLTQGESKGIQGANWELLNGAQQRKQELQRLVNEMPFPLLVDGQREEIPGLIEQIVQMEQENSAHLSRSLERVSRELATMDKGQRTLGQVRLSYVPRPTGVWSSYS
jgi:hypothetical protein